MRNEKQIVKLRSYIEREHRGNIQAFIYYANKTDGVDFGSSDTVYRWFKGSTPNLSHAAMLERATNSEVKAIDWIY
jgi:hypothetical protein